MGHCLSRQAAISREFLDELLHDRALLGGEGDGDKRDALLRATSFSMLGILPNLRYWRQRARARLLERGRI